MTHLLLFLKAPRSGQVKTRLAQSVGEATALEVYRLLVARQWAALPQDATVEVHYTPRDAAPEMQAWLSTTAAYYPQVEGGLGKRLTHAVAAAFERGARQVICIGGDCPQLVERHFKEAIDQLDAGQDVIFGPTEDGGYYLIALRAPQPELFGEIPWSTEQTLAASLKKAASLGLQVSQLETLFDVDEADDFKRAQAAGLIDA
jgi:rSAM/selenodomain-associated transferase 1